MVRRSLHVGLWLGLLAGLAWSLRHMLLLRRAAETLEVSSEPWAPLPRPNAEPTVPPPAVVADPTAAPTAATAPTAKAAPAPAIKPAKATDATKPAKARTWVAAPDGVAPPSHPVRAKTSSRIFRVPGMSGYDQTRPDRCYRSEEDALADGFTRAKR